MRYLCIYKPGKPEGTPPAPQEMAAMGELIADLTKSGILLATEGCLPTKLGFRVRRSGDKVTVTDGPFTETKEVVGGFALIKVDSKEQAIEVTKRFLSVAGDGESEVRQVYEAAGNYGDLRCDS